MRRRTFIAGLLATPVVAVIAPLVPKYATGGVISEPFGSHVTVRCGGGPYTDVFTASGTWTKRTNAKWTKVIIFGSGGRTARYLDRSALDAAETVTV